jgi:hypothetical protein
LLKTLRDFWDLLLFRSEGEPSAVADQLFYFCGVGRMYFRHAKRLSLRPLWYPRIGV